MRRTNMQGICQCCAREAYLVRDHNHVTGAQRAAICESCNVSIGHFEFAVSAPDRARQIAVYLQRYDLLWRMAFNTRIGPESPFLEKLRFDPNAPIPETTLTPLPDISVEVAPPPAETLPPTDTKRLTMMGPFDREVRAALRAQRRSRKRT